MSRHSGVMRRAIADGDVEAVALLWRNEMIGEELEKRIRRQSSDTGDLDPEDLLLSVVAPSSEIRRRSLEKAEELVAIGPFGLRDGICAHPECDQKLPKNASANAKFCSHNCRNRHWWLNKRPSEPEEKFCERPGCSEKFTLRPRGKHQKYCSKKCKASVGRTRRLKRRGIPTGERYGSRYGTCPQGHDRSEENTYIHPRTGKYACRVCRREDAAKKLRENPEHRENQRDKERRRRAEKRDAINARRREIHALKKAGKWNPYVGRNREKILTSLGVNAATPEPRRISTSGRVRRPQRNANLAGSSLKKGTSPGKERLHELVG